MNYKWLLLLLTVISTKTMAYEPSIEIIEQFDDIKLVAFIKAADLKDYPIWNSITDVPPLTVNKAIHAVQELYKSSGETFDANTVNEIELRKMNHHESYWHYLIKIRIRDASDSSEKLKYQVYVVLMTGKVIPALTETESYK